MVRARVALAFLSVASCALGCGGGPDAGGSTAPPLKARPLAPELRAATRAAEEQRFEDAQTLARKYVEAHPADGQACFLLGMTYYWTGNHGAARPWLERALELEPETYVVHDPLAYSLFLLGDLRGARREYEAFLAFVPDEPKGHYGLGLIELDEARLDEAEKRFRRAIELFAALEKSAPAQVAARLPELAECHARLAEVLFARTEYEAARAELAVATKLCPGNISAFYTLSLVERRLGHEAAADEAAARYESARQALIARQKGGRE